MIASISTTNSFNITLYRYNNESTIYVRHPNPYFVTFQVQTCAEAILALSEDASSPRAARSTVIWEVNGVAQLNSVHLKLIWQQLATLPFVLTHPYQRAIFDLREF